MLTYDFNSNEIRVVIGRDDEPYFVVEDICNILKIPNGRLDEEDRITYKLDEQEVIVTPESGLHELMMNSVGEKEFKRWALRELLPDLRKTAQVKSFPSNEMIHVLAVQKEVIFDEAQDRSYFSFNATAKLSGVREWVIKKALNNRTSGVYQIFHGSTNSVQTQKQLKFVEQWESGWKKVPDSIISKIIEYYAFEAPERNERAENTHRPFASVGIRNWVKEAVQYVEKQPIDADPREVLTSINEKLNVIQQTVQELSQQFSENQE